MNVITDQLTNRDIALLVWLVVFAILVLLIRSVRKSLPPLLRMLFFSKITIFLLLMVAYVALVSAEGYKVGAWQPWMLKDTMYWFFGSALTTFFSINNAAEDEHYFKRVVVSNVHVAVVLDFVINLYVFNLVVELLLIPIVTALAMLLVVAGSKPEYAPAKTVLQWLSALIGLAFVVHSGLELVSNPGSLATLSNLQDLLLPLVLTMLLLPFVYSVALYMTYESLYVRLKIFSRETQLTRYTMWQIVKACHVRLSRVRHFSDSFAFNVRHAETRAEVVAAINEFRATAHMHETTSAAK